jgi:Fe-S oxidoreductase
MLEAAGIETSAPETGCCDMTGAFGMRQETYEASVKIGNLSVLSKVKDAAAETLIVANGFSCREQIEGLGGRETQHLAEVLAKGL